MQRNFDHRIEVSTPIYDKEIQKELMTMIQIQMKDNSKARLLNTENVNEYKRTESEQKVRSQFEIYDFYRKQYIENK